tara:strand:- start:1068 stop:1280 length:213 start_codon:yes stop_codon:yes gene_type:complete
MKDNMYVCVNSGHGNNKYINLNNIDAIIRHENYGTVDFHMSGGSIITLPLKEMEDPHGILSKLREIYHMC